MSAPAPPPEVQCPGTVHPLRAGPDGGADALPVAGTTDLDDVRPAAEELRRELLADYPSAGSIHVARRDGDVWSRDANGNVEISPAADFQLVVSLGDVADCPFSPTALGVPVSFVIE